FLETVFKPDLEGHSLLSNNSKWLNFLLVKNAQWRNENVVMLGDALHTAHFSIGSGTKLAFEDAIALRDCFSGGANVKSALEEFERVRKPVIEEYQAAAEDSMVWFEHARDYMQLDPIELAYVLMTRSGKVDRESLQRRDPEFVEAYLRSRRQVQEAGAGGRSRKFELRDFLSMKNRRPNTVRYSCFLPLLPAAGLASVDAKTELIIECRNLGSPIRKTARLAHEHR
ncbi:MAG: hypothetical protein M3539_01685, partial [Acidobacteriota bacterium]|nr:hypothetical protein [Acidobacteriota bacterium]